MSGPRTEKRAEVAGRTLADDEVAALRMFKGQCSSRELLLLVERIVARHRNRAWAEGFARGRDPRPAWSELWGIDPDFTGGLSIDEYLDEMRGDA